MFTESIGHHLHARVDIDDRFLINDAEDDWQNRMSPLAIFKMAPSETNLKFPESLAGLIVNSIAKNVQASAASTLRLSTKNETLRLVDEEIRCERDANPPVNFDPHNTAGDSAGAATREASRFDMRCSVISRVLGTKYGFWPAVFINADLASDGVKVTSAATVSLFRLRMARMCWFDMPPVCSPNA